MSYTYTIAHGNTAASQTLQMGEICADLFPGALRIGDHQAVALDQVWGDEIHHFYVLRLSARSVEVDRDQQGFNVRILACSNRVDHELALGLVRNFARALDAAVLGEDFESPLSLSELDEMLAEGWLDHQLTSLPRTIATLIDGKGSAITLFGCVRPYVLGPKHLARLRSAGDDDGLSKRILDDIGRLQHLDLSHLFEASVMRVGDAGASDSYTLAVIGAGVHYFLPAVDRYGLMSDGDVVQIPWQSLESLLPGQVQRLDEQHAIVAPISDEDWPDFLERAAAVALSNDEVAGDAAETEYATLAEFWPYYLSEHRNPLNRALHVVGSLGGLSWIGAAVALQNPWWVLAGVLNGYAFAWVGHFIVEKNRPATFKYPLKSFLCDWYMLFNILTFRIGAEFERIDATAR